MHQLAYGKFADGRYQLINFDDHFEEHFDEEDGENPPEHLIINAFIWSKSPSGHEYWDLLHWKWTELLNNKIKEN